MDLSKLVKTTKKTQKRLGRGAGSGRGKTAGRGTKGQKARERVKAGFEGGQTPLTKRLPLARGVGNRKISAKPIPVNLKFLNLLPANSVVNLDSLIAAKIVDSNAAKKFGVKVLGDGKITIPLKVLLPTSLSAGKKIEAAGGSLDEVKTGASFKKQPKVNSKAKAKNERQTQTQSQNKR